MSQLVNWKQILLVSVFVLGFQAGRAADIIIYYTNMVPVDNLTTVSSLFFFGGLTYLVNKRVR